MWKQRDDLVPFVDEVCHRWSWRGDFWKKEILTSSRSERLGWSDQTIERPHYGIVEAIFAALTGPSGLARSPSLISDHGEVCICNCGDCCCRRMKSSPYESKRSDTNLAIPFDRTRNAGSHAVHGILAVGFASMVFALWKDSVTESFRPGLSSDRTRTLIRSKCPFLD